jgi:hypothetical protein
MRAIRRAGRTTQCMGGWVRCLAVTTVRTSLEGACAEVDSLERAKETAGRLLSGALPRRWAHVQGVAFQAAVIFGDPLLTSAAWLHDIGYSPAIAVTGFHPIDGARWLRTQGADDALVSLVAHHSCAHIEAGLRGLGDVLADEFPRHPSLPHDELCFCDLTTSPDGEVIPPEERLAEIRRRYPDGHVVRAFIDTAEGELLGTVGRVRAALAAA